jgi:hypothetical protein
MFVLVLIGWVFFRAVDLNTAASLLHRMFVPTGGVLFAGVETFIAVAGCCLWWAVAGPNAFDMNRDESVFRRRHAYAFAAAFGVCAAVMAGAGPSPFLYFQF